MFNRFKRFLRVEKYQIDIKCLIDLKIVMSKSILNSTRQQKEISQKLAQRTFTEVLDKAKRDFRFK